MSSSNAEQGSSSEEISLEDQLKKQKGWSRAFICVENEDSNGEFEVLAAVNITPSDGDLSVVRHAFDSYDATMTSGITIGGDHFDVHRYYDNLVYGRRGNPSKADSDGFCIAKLTETNLDKTVYGIITYSLPNISAREIPLLQALLKKNFDVITE